uniref:HAT C-terminal dimerisation domain-containing protein n=1 Tax=Esox lucius TaxID=8010 RepID=A0A6Q2XKQ7_ESOLU
MRSALSAGSSASFAGALAIVRNGKPFTDGEYAKTFMLDVANERFDDFPNKDKIIKRIKDIPLSARTVHDRSIMMANQVEETQIKDISAGTYFSLALDESTDVSHLSQCSIIARYAAGDTLREESLAVLPMKGTTRGEDLFMCVGCQGGRCSAVLQLLDNTDWLLQFHNLVDITGHLNQLNVKMQGIGKTISSLQQAVFAFESKLEVFLRDIETGHFELEVADLKASDMWMSKFKSLNGELKSLARQRAELAREHKWTEMKNLQPEDQLILKTWNELPVTYHTMQRVRIAVLTMFGSTYACEQSFSHMRNIKNYLRSRLTDGSLHKAISKTVQHQKSH